MKRSIEAVGEESLADSNKKIKVWSPIDFLVPDTLKIILSKLDLKNQLYARLVCMKWFHIINLSYFRIGALYRDELPSVVSVLSRYNKPISVSFKNLGRLNPETIEHLSKLTNLIELRGNIQKQDNFLSALTDLHSLTTDQLSTSVLTTLRNLTKLSCKELLGTMTVPMTQVQELQIKESSALEADVNLFPNVKRLKADFAGNCYLTGLESLSLADDYTCNGFPITLTELNVLGKEDSPLRAQLSRLTRLKRLFASESPVNPLDFPYLERWDAGHIRADTEFWERVSQHPHLTSLSVELREPPPPKYMTLLTNLVEFEALVSHLVPGINLDMSVFSTLSKFTKIEITGYGSHNSTAQNCTSLTALTNLQKFDVDALVTETFANTMTSLTSLRMWAGALPGGQKHCFTLLTNLMDLNLENAALRPTEMIEGLDRLTHLTKLTVASFDDEDWNQILKLTNLQSLAEETYLGKNVDLYTDLLALQRLTFLHVRSWCDVNVDHLTLLTTLQALGGQGISDKKQEEICSKLPYCKVYGWPNQYALHVIQSRHVNFVNIDAKK